MTREEEKAKGLRRVYIGRCSYYLEPIAGYSWQDEVGTLLWVLPIVAVALGAAWCVLTLLCGH